jgi:putative membrane protein
MSAAFAFLHHVAAFALVAGIVVEFVLMRQDLDAAAARRLALADMAVGLSAGVLLVVGLLRVFYFEKGPPRWRCSWRWRSPRSIRR